MDYKEHLRFISADLAKDSKYLRVPGALGSPPENIIHAGAFPIDA